MRRPRPPRAGIAVASCRLLRRSAGLKLGEPFADGVEFRLHCFGLAPQSLLLGLRVGLLIRRGVAAKPHPARNTGRVEPVSPSAAAATEASASTETASKHGTSIAGYSVPSAVAGRSAGHRTHSHGSGSISSWHFVSFLSVTLLPLRRHTSGTSAWRRERRVHAARAVRTSDTYRSLRVQPPWVRLGDRTLGPAIARCLDLF
jgi:hypothetical protein